MTEPPVFAQKDIAVGRFISSFEDMRRAVVATSVHSGRWLGAADALNAVVALPPNATRKQIERELRKVLRSQGRKLPRAGASDA